MTKANDDDHDDAILGRTDDDLWASEIK